jgi:hypothetical protein
VLDSCEAVWCVGALVRLVLSFTKWAWTDVGLQWKVGSGDFVAVQGLWRSALGHMHHTFLQRNYEKHLETMGYQATVRSRFGWL